MGQRLQNCDTSSWKPEAAFQRLRDSVMGAGRGLDLVAAGLAFGPKEAALTITVDGQPRLSGLCAGDVRHVLEGVRIAEELRARPGSTTRKQMRELREGDRFYVGGEWHTASSDAGPCGDASVDEYVVYDEDEEARFESEFPDYAPPAG